MSFFKQLIRSLFSFGLILGLLNLSIEIWNSPIQFAEINEEVEQVLDDEVSSEIILLKDLESTSGHAESLYNTQLQVREELLATCHYFEIDSPPPELV